MATPGVPESIRLYETAVALMGKGRYASAVEKVGDAAAAAAQELAAEDCLLVALLRAEQAEALLCHCMGPGLTVAEKFEPLKTVISVLLPTFVSTLTRRKEAGTLLPGSCRSAEVAWWRAIRERRMRRNGMSVEAARMSAIVAQELGLAAYLDAACVVIRVLDISTPSMPRDEQLSHAAFIASALDLMALPRELPSMVADNGTPGVLVCPSEQHLAQTFRFACEKPEFNVDVDGEAFALMADAWRRVERSGAIARRMLKLDTDPATSVTACLDAAAAEAAVRGLRGCALADCAAKEVHVSQFKRCSACQQAFYCCREHQLEDWPAHKVACKAARKNAAVKS
jgi:hypothetical protein